MATKSSKRKSCVQIILITLASISIIICVGIYTSGKPVGSDKTEQNSGAVLTTESRIPSEKISTTISETPIVIYVENSIEYDGVKFSITGIHRQRDFINPENQYVTIDLLLQSGNLSLMGFDLKMSELIIEDLSGLKRTVETVFPMCRIYDNESCSRKAKFAIPLSNTSIKLYYVSDKRLDGKEPIDVTDPNDRYFVAEIYLQNIMFEPTSTATVTSNPTSTPTLTATIDPFLTPTKPPPAAQPSQKPGEEIVYEWEGVVLGMCSDDVLKIHPKSETVKDPEVLGTDSQGLIVKWSYSRAHLIFAIREGQDGISCYRVQEILLDR